MPRIIQSSLALLQIVWYYWYHPIESFNSVIKEYRSKEPLILLTFILQWALSQRNKQLSLLSNKKYCKVAYSKENIRKNEADGLAIEKQKGTFRVNVFD